MDAIIPIYKPLGKTPLQMIQMVKENYPAYKEITISYAGRLDPMAEGLLLLLLGDENKKRHVYEKLKKTYVFEVLFGVQTDTYDILGKILSSRIPPEIMTLKKQVREVLPSFQGEITQLYPPYSSFHIQGKPLFYWARENKLSNIIIPAKIITIYDFKLISSSFINKKNMQNTILQKIASVQGDFRQEEIKKTWKNFFNKSASVQFPLYQFTVTCSSGTYIRSLANTLGTQIGIPALAYSIKRTTIGDFSLDKAMRMF